MDLRQFAFSLSMALLLLVFVVRLMQKGKLDIAYCWVWLGVGLLAPLIVLKYDWFVRFSRAIGAVTPTTTLFLCSILALFLMCLQFSIVISSQRRQIKRLAQQLALRTKGK